MEEFTTKPTEKEFFVTTSIQISEKDLRLLINTAGSLGISRNKLIRDIIKGYLNSKKA